MPVSVCLETGKDAYVWSNQRLNLARVVSDCAEINFNPGWPIGAHHHDLFPTGCLSHQLFVSLLGLGHQ
jgi:hypothetical protein